MSELAQRIVRELDRTNSIWQKWDGDRELVLKSALPCWIPAEDLREFLNRMPGPALTATDVAQRFKAAEEEDHYGSLANEALRDGCLALYEREKAAGTELPAIIGAIRDHVELEEERLRKEQRERYERVRDEERLAREQRLLSGADCNWTQLGKASDLHCRKNGRTYRLSPTEDGMWNLYRVNSVEDATGGLVGKCRQRAPQPG